VLDKAVALADVAGFERRRREDAARGLRRGLGIGCFLEMSGGPVNEHAGLSVVGEQLELTTGTQSNGQGHETVLAELAAERLGIAREQVRVVQGDSARIARGVGSFGSRSMMLAGAATLGSVARLIDRGRALAADIFEAAEIDVVYDSGAFMIAGTDRRMTLFDLARAARDRHGGFAAGLDVSADVEIGNSYPNGCHIAEIVIDPETGVARLVRYSAVDDCGTVIHPTLVDGQLHGGIAQGLGQVLLEHGVFDRRTGQLLTGSFMDYALPRADTLPTIVSAFHPVPSRTNPLGVKGVGEAGTTGALCALMNAVVDAIGTQAATRLAMPATPERIWRAILGH
jgi:carbon-monoxide dehydrogenase large subunit